MVATHKEAERLVLRIATPIGEEYISLDEIVLSEKVEREIEEARERFPDFSPEDVQLYHFMPARELSNYGPELVNYVALKYGFDVPTNARREQFKFDICVHGGMYGTHEGRMIRIDGDWYRMPAGFNYLEHGKAVMCPECGAKEKVQAKKREASVSLLRKRGVGGGLKSVYAILHAGA